MFDLTQRRTLGANSENKSSRVPVSEQNRDNIITFLPESERETRGEQSSCRQSFSASLSKLNPFCRISAKSDKRRSVTQEQWPREIV